MSTFRVTLATLEKVGNTEDGTEVWSVQCPECNRVFVKAGTEEEIRRCASCGCVRKKAGQKVNKEPQLDLV
jgi:uncharacterized Zn finger protein